MITPTEESQYIEEIKKSKFIVRVKSINSKEEAVAFIKEVSEPEARHNCWAYKIGNEYRFSDDGEPTGTAGKPIYSAIDNLNFDQVVIVVVRYFGGIKLGAGGLIRAYGGTSASALRNTKTKEIEFFEKLQIESTFNYLNKVHLCIKKYEMKNVVENFNEDGCQFEMFITKDLVTEFQKEIEDLTRGNISVKII